MTIYCSLWAKLDSCRLVLQLAFCCGWLCGLGLITAHLPYFNFLFHKVQLHLHPFYTFLRAEVGE